MADKKRDTMISTVARKAMPLYYAAAAATAIAGILHLIAAPNMLNFNPNGAILFLAGGAAQIFWALPMARIWGKAWYSIGIAGTVVFMLIWVVTRMPGNPITGRGGGVNEMAIAVQAAQGIFVGLAVAILAMEMRARKASGRTAESEQA